MNKWERLKALIELDIKDTNKKETTLVSLKKYDLAAQQVYFRVAFLQVMKYIHDLERIDNDS